MTHWRMGGILLFAFGSTFMIWVGGTICVLCLNRGVANARGQLNGHWELITIRLLPHTYIKVDR